MLSIFRSYVRRSTLPAAFGALMMVSMFDAPLRAQTLTGVGGGNICSVGGNIVVYTNDDTCDFGASGDIQTPDGFEVANADFDSAFGTTTFTNGTVSFNSVTTAFGGGSVAFNAPVTFSGSSAIFSTPTTFQNPSTFNGAADFNAAITTSGISNAGTITSSAVQTGTLGVTTNLTVGAGALVNMGGNRVQGVAAGTANTDAVNVAQLNAATSGITTDVTALETLTATHTTQIAAIETVNTTQSAQISAIQTVNATQATQIDALEASGDLVSGRVDELFDLRSVDRRDMKQGIASAIAIAPAPMPSAPGKLSYAFNGASFRGERAVGGSLMYRLPSQTPMAVNVGFSYAGNKNNGVRVGVAGEF